MKISLKWIGTATVVIRLPGLHFITDPVLDAGPSGAPVRIGRTGLVTYRRLAAAQHEPGDLAGLQLCLLSHEQHADHLDASGRALLPRLPLTLTTRAGAARLRKALPEDRLRGLAPWESIELPASVGATGARVRVTAVPARHGPPLFHRLAGPVIGFILEHPELTHGALLFSGDTRNTRSWREVAARFRIGTAWVNLGAARFWLTGPVRYSMDASEAGRFCRQFPALKTVVPLHYRDWSQFREPHEAARRRLTVPRAHIAWLPQGSWQDLEV